MTMNSTTKTDRTFSTILSGAATLALLLVGTSAFAGEASDVAPSAIVKFSDLNVSTSVGALALYKRIHTTAQLVCSTNGTWSMQKVQREAACVDQAEARAVAQVNTPTLTAYYRQKIGMPSATVPTLAANVGK
jgi:UrcA family protein